MHSKPKEKIVQTICLTHFIFIFDFKTNSVVHLNLG